MPWEGSECLVEMLTKVSFYRKWSCHKESHSLLRVYRSNRLLGPITPNQCWQNRAPCIFNKPPSNFSSSSCNMFIISLTGNPPLPKTRLCKWSKFGLALHVYARIRQTNVHFTASSRKFSSHNYHDYIPSSSIGLTFLFLVSHRQCRTSTWSLHCFLFAWPLIHQHHHPH